MTELDDDLVPAVEEILDELGAPITLLDDSGATYDSATGDVTGAPTSRTTTGSPLYHWSKLLGGRAGFFVLVRGANLGFVPVEGWKCDVAGQRYVVARVSPIPSGSLVAAYELELTR